MGQTVSAPSTPHLPSSLKGKGKGKGKARRHTTEPFAPLPGDSDAIVYSREQQQLIARYLAEEKLEGRTPRLVIRDDAASPQWGKVQDDEEEHLEGLRINVGGRRLDKSRSAFTGLEIVSDSQGSQDVLHEACKKHERTLSASSQPLSRSRSAAPPSLAHTWHPSSSRRRGSAFSEHGYLNFRPPSPSPIPIGARDANTSPTSHWSESSADGRTPPLNFNTFRNSANFTLNPKRLSTTSSNPRHSLHEPSHHSLANDLMAPTKPLQKAIEKGLQGYRANKENERRRKALKKRGPIVVVGAQRVGSGRYSMMREAAARSAATRKESLGSKDGLASRRESKDSNGRRRSSTSEGKRTSASRRGSGPTRDEEGGSSTPPNVSSSASSPSFLHRRSPSAQAFMSFIAASPDLTCPDPAHPLFDLQATPRPSIARLPEGHPANHHARFRSYNERVAALPPNPAGPAAFASGPAPLPARGVLAQRRASALAGSTRSSVGSAYAHMEPQDGFEGARRSSSFSGASSRKLSNYRLSIAEPRDEAEVAGSRRSSVASWTTTNRSRSRLDSVDHGHSNEASAWSKGSAGAGVGRRQSTVSLGNDRRPSTTSMPFISDAPVLPSARSNSVVSRTSFPHSVAYTADSTRTPYRDTRLGSTASYFSMPSTTLDLPVTPETVLTPLADVNRTPKPSAASTGKISWGSYSLAPAPLPMDASSRGSVTSVFSEIAPETMDAFPAPPTSTRPLRLHVPTPLVIKKHQPFPYDTESSLLSDASTPSTGSFDSASTSSTTSQGLLQLQQEEAFGTGSGFAQTLEMLSNAVQISLEGQGSTYKAPPSPSLSLGGNSAATFTMDDLMQLGGNSWSSAEAVRTSALPPAYHTATVASLPVLSSSPLVPSAPSTPKLKTLARRPSEHQLEHASPNLSLPAQPLPTTTSKRQAPPIFADWKMRVSTTAPLRLPTVVSPMTDPFTSGYYEEEDLEVEDAAPSFVRVISTARSGVKKSFLDCSPTPPHQEPTNEPKGLGLDDVRPFSTIEASDNRRFSFTPRELAITSARRDTHPTWTPPSMRKAGGLDVLVEKKKGRSASEDTGGVSRLGSMGKRGFSKSEVSDWLTTASRETVPVTRKL